MRLTTLKKLLKETGGKFLSYVGFGNELLRYGLLRKIWNQILKPSRKQENKELIIKIVPYMMNLTVSYFQNYFPASYYFLRDKAKTVSTKLHFKTPYMPQMCIYYECVKDNILVLVNEFHVYLFSEKKYLSFVLKTCD